MRSFDVDFLSMGQAANLYFQNVKPEKTTEQNKEVVSFQDVLNAKVEQEVKFSKHANQRLENRNIELSEDCLLYTSPSPRDRSVSRMPSSA